MKSFSYIFPLAVALAAFAPRLQAVPGDPGAAPQTAFAIPVRDNWEISGGLPENALLLSLQGLANTDAPRVYIDYPAGSPQAAINTAMQPLTFSVTIVSALSLYSLFFTVYKSKYKWSAPGTALFLALVSWLIAGRTSTVTVPSPFTSGVT